MSFASITLVAMVAHMVRRKVTARAQQQSMGAFHRNGFRFHLPRDPKSHLIVQLSLQCRSLEPYQPRQLLLSRFLLPTIPLLRQLEIYIILLLHM